MNLRVKRHTCDECRYFVYYHCTNAKAHPWAREMASDGREACVDFKEKRNRKGEERK